MLRGLGTELAVLGFPERNEPRRRERHYSPAIGRAALLGPVEVVRQVEPLEIGRLGTAGRAACSRASGQDRDYNSEDRAHREVHEDVVAARFESSIYGSAACACLSTVGFVPGWDRTSWSRRIPGINGLHPAD